MTATDGGLARPPGPIEPGARPMVLGLWLAMSASGFAFVAAYGPSFPRWDDFTLVTFLTGSRPISLEWLWSQHNEHRVMLPRLVLLGLLRLTKGDFRAGMAFNVACLSGLSLAMILVARARRGGWSTADAAFPLILLNLGHQANMLWCWQVQFILSTALAGTLLLLIATGTSWPDPSKALRIGVVLGLLPLCGANGLALVPAMAAWLLASSAAQFGRRKRDALVNMAVAAAVGLLVLAYFRSYRTPGHQATRAGLGPAIVTTLQFLSLTLGPAASDLWSYSGIFIGASIVATLALLVRVAIFQAEERPRALGFLAFLGGLLSLAIGLGWGRAGSGALSGFEPRYVTLSAPVGCAIALIWSIYGGTPALRRVIPLGLAATMLALLWPNTQVGLAEGRALAVRASRLEREVRLGTPMHLIVRDFAPLLHPSQDELSAVLPQLRAADIGLFRTLRPDPPFREVDVPLEPTSVRLARWDRGTAHVTGVDPLLTFALPSARYVAGIRIRYAHANREGTPARFRIDWGRPGSSTDSQEHQYANWNLPTGPGRTTTVWVGEVVDGFAIQPDNQPCEFRIDSITLLVPSG